MRKRSVPHFFLKIGYEKCQKINFDTHLKNRGRQLAFRLFACVTRNTLHVASMNMKIHLVLKNTFYHRVA